LYVPCRKGMWSIIAPAKSAPIREIKPCNKLVVVGGGGRDWGILTPLIPPPFQPEPLPLPLTQAVTKHRSLSKKTKGCFPQKHFHASILVHLNQLI